jgi:hypothetical protein
MRFYLNICEFKKSIYLANKQINDLPKSLFEKNKHEEPILGLEL